MNLLDYPKENMNSYKPNTVILVALTSLILLGFGLQIEAIYSDYLVNKSRIEEPGLMICFYSAYMMRWCVQLFGFLGLGLSISILHRRHWTLLESNLYNLVLLGPILILILDQIMVLTIL